MAVCMVMQVFTDFAGSHIFAAGAVSCAACGDALSLYHIGQSGTVLLLACSFLYIIASFALTRYNVRKYNADRGLWCLHVYSGTGVLSPVALGTVVLPCCHK